jgi:hypothetical protein
LSECRIDEKIEENLLSNFFEDSTNYDKESEYIEFLDQKIENYEFILKNYNEKKDNFINREKYLKESVNVPLEKIMNSDELESIQDNYMQNRAKVRASRLSGCSSITEKTADKNVQKN